MATSLKDIKFSQEGEPKQEVKQEEQFIFPTEISSGEQPGQGEAYNIIFKLVHKKKGRTHLDSICNNVLNPKTGKRERAWLLMGAASIWQSELTEVLKDKDYVNKSRYGKIFEDGVCRISSLEANELEFLRVNSNNVGKNRGGNGKYDFYEYDPAEEQKQRLKVQSIKIDMIIKAKEMPVEKMKKLASFLDIKPYDELGQLKGDDGVRAELMIKADTMPTTFAKYLDSPEVEIAYMVKKAIVEAKIDLTGQNGNALWAGGKGFITKIPSTKKPYEYLTELAMTNSNEGRAFKEQLETMN